MTNYTYLTTRDFDEFAVWLDEHVSFEDSPWMKWFDENYCSKCEPIIVGRDDYGRDKEYAPCELKDDTTGEYKNPCGFAHCDIVKIVKAWLVQEAEYENP